VTYGPKKWTFFDAVENDLRLAVDGG